MSEKRRRTLGDICPNVAQTSRAMGYSSSNKRQEKRPYTVQQQDSGKEIICLDSDDEKPPKLRKICRPSVIDLTGGSHFEKVHPLRNGSTLGSFISTASVDSWQDDGYELEVSQPTTVSSAKPQPRRHDTNAPSLEQALFGDLSSSPPQPQAPSSQVQLVPTSLKQANGPQSPPAYARVPSFEGAYPSSRRSDVPTDFLPLKARQETDLKGMSKGCPPVEQGNNHRHSLPSNPARYTLTANSVIDPFLGNNVPQELPVNPIQPITEPELCPEQRALVDLIVSGRNVFYTGSAGCGKSTVLKAFVRQLRNMGREVRIIAPTGRAALDIGGSTFWTFAGWTPLHMKKPLKQIIKAGHGKWIRKRLKETDVLVLDEISMVENHHFERLNKLMKEARGSDEAFGGVQIVVTGDFCQLPPVKPFAYCIECGRETLKKLDGNHKCPQHGEYKDEDKWAFRSTAWRECGFEHVCLRTIHRQSDRVFIDILEKCRMGKVLNSNESDLLLTHPTNFENAVKLFSTREEVRRVNQAEFDRLKSEKHSFKCLDVFKEYNELPKWLHDKYSKRTADGSLEQLRDHKYDALIDLKEEMLVVLLTNLDISAGLVNGSQGQLVGWENYDAAKLPKAKEKDGGRRSEKFEGSMQPAIMGDHATHREQSVKDFIQQARIKAWPIIKFDNGITRTIFADCTVHEIGDEKPYNLLSRTQIPLLPAWAMSIHKSQGMTLNRAIVDLARSFEEGQMYVALSRARSLDGLKVENLGHWRMRGNEQVMQFLWEKFKIK